MARASQALKSAPVFYVVLLSLALLLLALLGPGFLQAVAAMGHNIPQANVAGDYLFGLFWASAIGISMLFWPVPQRLKAPLMGAWIAKCVVMLGVMLIMENQYDIMDSWGYFRDSVQRVPLFDGVRFGDGTANIICLARLHSRIFPYSYHGMKVTFGLFGFLGCYLFYRAVVMYLGYEDRRMFYLMFFWPSILFWSSFLGKDPIVYFGLGLYALGAVGWLRTRRARYVLYLAVGVLIATMIRFWMGPILLGPLAVFAFFAVRNLGSRILLSGALAVGFIVGAQQVMVRFSNENRNENAVESMSNYTESESGRGGSGQEVEVDLSDPKEALRFLPLGVFTTLFRPLPGEVKNLFGTLAGLEDTALLVLMFLAVTRTSWERLREPAMLWLSVLIMGWAVAYAPISSLNLGMGHRYRLQVMPFMLCWLLYQARKRPKLVYVPSEAPGVERRRAAL
jgi:hypothetical protein